ncbi:MAG: DUF6569 family protein [Candidatus Latescibacterota bacterium]|nr:DUF6569 family protein [Candidatus Latescibacterota bacterium]
MLEINLGPVQQLEDLVVFPLVSPEKVELPYETLSDAVMAGIIDVSEIEQGVVSALHVCCRGARNVLALDGEQFVGVKQNRTTSRTVLLSAEGDTMIPVSCMEQGRWSSHGRHFRVTPDHSPTRVRRQSREAERDVVSAGRSPSPDALTAAQATVWGEIDALSESLGAPSATGALDEAYAARRADFAYWSPAFPVMTGQVGLLVITAKGPLGLDVVGSQVMYKKLHAGILNGYLMDGLGQGAVGRGLDSYAPPYRFTDPQKAAMNEPRGHQHAARRFLRHITKADRTEAPTVGLGSYSVLTGAVVGGELVHEQMLVHVSAFPAPKGSQHHGARGGKR